jgi:hypothetical protein
VESRRNRYSCDSSQDAPRGTFEKFAKKITDDPSLQDMVFTEVAPDMCMDYLVSPVARDTFDGRATFDSLKGIGSPRATLDRISDMRASERQSYRVGRRTNDRRTADQRKTADDVIEKTDNSEPTFVAGVGSLLKGLEKIGKVSPKAKEITLNSSVLMDLDSSDTSRLPFDRTASRIDDAVSLVDALTSEVRSPKTQLKKKNPRKFMSLQSESISTSASSVSKSPCSPLQSERPTFIDAASPPSRQISEVGSDCTTAPPSFKMNHSDATSDAPASERPSFMSQSETEDGSAGAKTKRPKGKLAALAARRHVSNPPYTGENKFCDGEGDKFCDGEGMEDGQSRSSICEGALPKPEGQFPDVSESPWQS